MSIESAREYLARMASDPGFRSAIEAAGGAGARGEIVTRAGIEPFTAAELDSAAAELSDDDLASVSGGSGDPHVDQKRRLSSMHVVSFNSTLGF